ncbi:hypothetical protein BSKO_08313 [Bryopsis sp. KO-2023]|nr:hypothetical protein BSKO_08313 [Bryopsis sp. KO-2023]
MFLDVSFFFHVLLTEGDAVIAESECKGDATATTEESITKAGDVCGGASQLIACSGSGAKMCCAADFDRGLCRCEDCDGPWVKKSKGGDLKKVFENRSAQQCFCLDAADEGGDDKAVDGETPTEVDSSAGTTESTTEGGTEDTGSTTESESGDNTEDTSESSESTDDTQVEQQTDGTQQTTEGGTTEEQETTETTEGGTTETGQTTEQEQTTEGGTTETGQTTEEGTQEQTTEGGTTETGQTTEGGTQEQTTEGGTTETGQTTEGGTQEQTTEGGTAETGQTTEGTQEQETTVETPAKEAVQCPGATDTSCSAFATLEILVTGGTCSGKASVRAEDSRVVGQHLAELHGLRPLLRLLPKLLLKPAIHMARQMPSVLLMSELSLS